jgi:hypothetical protein
MLGDMAPKEQTEFRENLSQGVSKAIDELNTLIVWLFPENDGWNGVQ